jgi:rhodanese-related sulfurtransferase
MPYTETKIPEVTPREVKEMIKQGKDPSLVDVRELQEVMAGKIENAKHIPLGEVLRRFDELDKDKEHIIVCRSGNRSELASEWLHQKGYKVKNMVGGMIDWNKS